MNLACLDYLEGRQVANSISLIIVPLALVHQELFRPEAIHGKITKDNFELIIGEISCWRLKIQAILFEPNRFRQMLVKAREASVFYFFERSLGFKKTTFLVITS